MKMLLIAAALALVTNAVFADHHEETKKTIKHDKEHHHVEEGSDHEHDDKHHADHDHVSRHALTCDELYQAIARARK